MGAPDAAWLTVAGVASATICLALVPPVRRLAVALRLVDQPEAGRRLHLHATPRAGGLAVFAAVGLVTLVLARFAPAAACVGDIVPGLLAGGAVLLLVGLLDDRWALRPRHKVLGQVAAALTAYGLGVRPDMPLVSGTPLEAAAFTLWVVAVSNAYNLIDGLDGLASSVALVALSAVAVYGAQFGHPAVVTVAVVVGGALVGFLRHNSAPATIFLGDCGSLVVGFWLAALTLLGAQGAQPEVSLLMAVCALPLPFLDTAAAVLRRWLRHRPLFHADAQHIHHRLLALGYGPRGVVSVVVVMSSAFAIFGIIIGVAPRATATATGVLGAVAIAWLLMYGTARLAYHEFVEALSMLVAAPRRARRVVRVQIAARDVAGMLPRAGSVAEINELLAAHAGDLGFSRLVLQTVGGAHGPRLPWRVATDVDTWAVVYPVGRPAVRHLLVGTSPRGPRMDGTAVERVARLLLPSLDRWAAANAAAVAHPPGPAPAGLTAIRDDASGSEPEEVAASTYAAAHAGHVDARTLGTPRPGLRPYARGAKPA